MVRISLVVMTLNEAVNIGACLDSARHLADEMLVVDSFSGDDTVAIAAEKGARIIQRPFPGYRQQREFAIAEASYDYILALDADECLSSQLADSVKRAKEQWDADGYTMNRLNYLGDTPLHYGGWYPDRKLRLFDRRKGSMGGSTVHDRIELQSGSSIRHLRGDILHRTNTDITDRIHTINRFSSGTARELHDLGVRGSHLRMLVKPTFRFLSEYLLRLGFLDGLAGYVVARTSAQYVFLREAKLLELQGMPSEAPQVPKDQP